MLIVDDDPMMRTLYETILAGQFDVLSAASGEEALKTCRQGMPDLILLDIEMPVLSGYEVCKRVRESSAVPIIFVTAHQSVDEHLNAYKAGGNDIITKPIDIQILLHKVSSAISNHRQQQKLAQEKAELHGMAMGFLSTMGESGILLNFMRASLGCRTYVALAEKLIAAAQEFGVECSVLIRNGAETTILISHGEATSLEQSILEKSSTMGKVFQFKNRLVVNYERVSVMISNLPDDEAKAGRIRDNITILAETAEALSENVDMRQESMARAEKMQIALGNASAAIERLRGKNRQMLMDTRLLLQELITNVEKTYSWLDTTHAQEKAISGTMDESVQRILNVLAVAGETEQDFNKVLEALRENNVGDVDDVFF